MRRRGCGGLISLGQAHRSLRCYYPMPENARDSRSHVRCRDFGRLPMSSQNELQVELKRHPKAGRKPLRIRLTLQTGLEHLREAGNRITGGGLRSLSNRRLKRLRTAADRITGGGLRALAKRLLSTSLRRAISHYFLRALGRSALQPFPKLSAHLYRLATVPD